MSGEPIIDRAQIERLAELAQLELADDELGALAAELSAILGYLQRLGAVDVSEVEPTAQVVDRPANLRADACGTSLDAATALEQAPRSGQGCFLVPGFLDES